MRYFYGSTIFRKQNRDWIKRKYVQIHIRGGLNYYSVLFIFKVYNLLISIKLNFYLIYVTWIYLAFLLKNDRMTIFCNVKKALNCHRFLVKKAFWRNRMPSGIATTVFTAHCIVAIRRGAVRFSHRNINLTVLPGDSLDSRPRVRCSTMLRTARAFCPSTGPVWPFRCNGSLIVGRKIRISPRDSVPYIDR